VFPETLESWEGSVWVVEVVVGKTGVGWEGTHMGILDFEGPTLFFFKQSTVKSSHSYAARKILIIRRITVT
jgi:hypothetical protein